MWSGTGILAILIPDRPDPHNPMTQEIRIMATSSPKDTTSAHAALPAYTHGRGTQHQTIVIPMPGGLSPLSISGAFPLTADAHDYLLATLGQLAPGMTVPADEVEEESASFRNDVAAALGMSPDDPDAELLRSLHQLAD